MTGEELVEWMAFNRLWPIADPWVQTGVTCRAIANSGYWKKKSGHWRIEDFMPVDRIIRRPPTADETRTRLDAMIEAQSRR